MSSLVVIIILAAALLHALWNSIIKAAPNPAAASLLTNASGAVLGLIGLLLVVAPARTSWPYAAVSIALQAVYFLLLTQAYRSADFARAYPVMRGLAPLFASLGTWLFVDEELGLAAYVAVALIRAGIVSLVATPAEAPRGGLWVAALNAVVIASYTVVDGLGARASGAPVAYAMVIFLGTGCATVPLLLVTYGRRSSLLAPPIPWLAVAGGAATMLSYGAVLWAMTRAPIALVAALRETSVLFAALIAAFYLRERLTRLHWLAILAIALGAGMLRVAVPHPPRALLTVGDVPASARRK